MALNFLHSGLRPVPPEPLRRLPGPLHVSVYGRVSGYFRACCRRGSKIPFCAFLLCGLGLSDYDGAACELHVPALDPHNGRTRLAPHVRDDSGELCRDLLVPHAPGGPDCLRPCRPLNAEAIVLSGEANWDIGPYLDPGMLLAYREPAVLEASGDLKGPSPSFGREDRAEVFRLMKVWDAKALLLLRPGVLPDIRCSRVFGSFKSASSGRSATGGDLTVWSLGWTGCRTCCLRASCSQRSTPRGSLTSSEGARPTARTFTPSAWSPGSVPSAMPSSHLLF